MKHLREILYWMGHGFPLHRAWNLARHPCATPTPAWQVYTATAAAFLGFAAVMAAIAYPYLKDFLK